MSEYRDFGGGFIESVEELTPLDMYPDNRSRVDTIKYSQVYTATHKGENYLPFMNRSFISFSFGGKNIEDYNLIATTENNRMNRAGSAEFEDLVDQYNILDGQFYWGTHFKPNKITFKLATDGMTQLQLDNFLSWFAGGKTRELILAEHPNRAILARISNPPQLALLPFEEPTEVIVNKTIYKTSTTVYRGEITLEFTMDSPFWYAKINIFGQMDSQGVYHDTWTDANGEVINIYDEYKNLDVMKIVLEDNIPTSSMIIVSMLLGNNVFANLDSSSGGHIAKHTVYSQIYYDSTLNLSYAAVGTVVLEDPPESINVYIFNDQQDISNFQSDDSGERCIISDKDAIIQTINMAHGSTVVSDSSTIEQFADAIASYFQGTEYEEYTIHIEDTDIETHLYDPAKSNCARIAGPHMAQDTGVETFTSGSAVYFYYAGTTYSLPQIDFSLFPLINGSGYIYSPSNTYAQDASGQPYNMIIITSLETQEFRFTTPNLYTSYNEAISIFRNAMSKTGESWESIRILIRDNVKHFAVRAWATKVIDFYVKKYNSKVIVNASSALVLMNKFLQDNNGDIPSSSYTFDSQNGLARGTFKYREMRNTNFNFSLSSEIEQFMNATNSLVTKEEDVGDMVKSKYLVIKDRNHPDAEGQIVAWASTNDYTKTYSHKIEHNVTNNLYNLFIRYQNMYL